MVLWFFLLGSLLPLLGCRGTPAGSVVPSDLATHGALRIGTSGDYAPFSWWPEDAARPSGFSIDVALAYAQDRDLEPVFLRFAWPELTSALEQDRFDLVLSGVTIRPDRSIAGRFGLPLTTSGAMALVPATSPIRSPEALDRAGVRIAVNAGGHLERVARRLFPRARIEALPDNAAVPGRLAEGRVDAVVSDSLEAPHWQASLPGTRALGPLTRDRKGAWFPASAGRSVRDFDAWLMRAEADGRLARLRRAHGLPETETAEPVAALLASLDERLSLMSEVARVKSILGAPVEDREREQRVLRAAVRATREAARAVGAREPDPLATRRLFVAQMDAAKWLQREWLRDAKQPTTAPAAEAERAARERLEQAIRPALIHLGDRIATLVVAAASPDAGSRTPSTAELARELGRHALPPARLQAIHDALAAILVRPDSAPQQQTRQSAGDQR